MTFSSSSKTVKTSTSTPGHRFFTSRVTSIPLIRGRPRSWRMTSGRVFASSSRAASPDRGEEITSTSVESCRIFIRFFRICGWSSTTITLIFGFCSALIRVLPRVLRPSGFRDWRRGRSAGADRQIDSRAPARRGSHLHPAVHLGGALAHVGEPVMSLSLQLTGIAGHIEPRAVILDAEPGLARLEGEGYVDGDPAPAVLAHVGERLLQYAEEREGALRTDRFLGSCDREPYLEAVPRRGELAIVAQGARQVEAVLHHPERSA